MTGDRRQEAAERLVAAAGDLADGLAAGTRADDVSPMLATLADAQQRLADVYLRLAVGHERAAVAEVLADGGAVRNASWIAADVALRLASQSAGAAAESLRSAQLDNGMAIWFEDLESEA